MNPEQLELIAAMSFPQPPISHRPYYMFFH
jgi:hypothetical protein